MPFLKRRKKEIPAESPKVVYKDPVDPIQYQAVVQCVRCDFWGSMIGDYDPKEAEVMFVCPECSQEQVVKWFR